MNPEIFVVSAWWPECSALAQLCGATSMQPLTAGQWVFCPQKKAVLLCTGIGAVAAAVAVSRVLAEFKNISQVLFCGTAGHYNPEIEMERVFYSTESFCSDAGIMLEKSYFPPHRAKAQSLLSDSFLNAALTKNAQSAKCLTVPSITETSDLALLFSKWAELEHLEFHGMASAAHAFQKKWAGFFGVSNTVGPKAHVQWKCAHEGASLASQTALYAAIFGGG